MTARRGESIMAFVFHGCNITALIHIQRCSCLMSMHSFIRSMYLYMHYYFHYIIDCILRTIDKHFLLKKKRKALLIQLWCQNTVLAFHKNLHFCEHDSSQNITCIGIKIGLEVDRAISPGIENQKHSPSQASWKTLDPKVHRSSYIFSIYFPYLFK